MKTIHDEEKIKHILENTVWGYGCKECSIGGFDYDNQCKCRNCNGTGICEWIGGIEALKKYAEHIAMQVRLKTIDEAIGCVPSVKDVHTWETELLNNMRDKTITNLEQLKK